MNDFILETRKLRKVYNFHTINEFEALHDIDFKVRKGEFIAIMGPSGSGKSTFINNISTIDLPTSGLVFISGVEIRTMGSNDIGRFRYQNLGFIFQDFHLLNTHTVYENIAMPLALKKEPKHKIKERVNELASKMNIYPILNKYPDECSGGQQQRAAICRALVNHPQIIIADEPTGNLDSANSIELMKIFTRLHEQEITIIMVTHDPLVASYSTKTIFISDGWISNEVICGSLSQEEYYTAILNIDALESKEAFQR